MPIPSRPNRTPNNALSIPYLLEARLVDDGPVDEREGTPAAGGVDQLHAALVPDLFQGGCQGCVVSARRGR